MPNALLTPDVELTPEQRRVPFTAGGRPFTLAGPSPSGATRLSERVAATRPSNPKRRTSNTGKKRRRGLRGVIRDVARGIERRARNRRLNRGKKK